MDTHYLRTRSPSGVFRENEVSLPLRYSLLHTLRLCDPKVFLACSTTPTTFIKPYKLQHVFCYQTSYWPRTITGDSDGLLWMEQKARSMKKLFLFFIISPGNARYFLCDHAITDRVGNPQFIDRFFRFLNRVDRTCDDLNLFSFELLI